MPSRSRFILTVLALGALVCSVIAAWWWFDADHRSFYTDDASIRQYAAAAPVRDILWREPESLQSSAGEVIVGRDPFVSAEGDVLLLTRQSDAGDTDLFIASRVGDAWTQPRPMGELNTIDNELSPALSADGQRLYFASDRPGGAGGLDIWMSVRQGDLWGEPTPLALNSRFDETDPHPLIQRDGVEGVLFASNRPRASEVVGEERTDFDLYLAQLDQSSVRHLAELSSPGADAGPAVAPAGDFVYFTSDREGGTGGHDLYRARLHDDGVLGPVRTLGPSINTANDEFAPSLSLEGFAIQFATTLHGDSIIRRAVSREVYLARSTTRGDLLSLLPWILIALAFVLVLAMLRRVVRNAQWQARIATLGLMAKCALVSLLVHGGLLALLAAMQVPPSAGPPEGDSQGLRVALSSSAVRSSISEQMHGSSAPATLEQASQPSTPAPAASMSSPSVTQNFQPNRTQTPIDRPMRPSTRTSESAPVDSHAEATQVDVSMTIEAQPPGPSLALPEAVPAQPLAHAEEGIRAPAQAATASATNGTDIEAAIEPSLVRLDAARSFAGDDTRLASFTAPSDTSPRDDASAGSMELPGIDLPRLEAATLSLATPTTGESATLVHEPGIELPRPASDSPDAPPDIAAGDVPLPLTEIDPKADRPEIAPAALTSTISESAPGEQLPEAVPTLDLPVLAFDPPQVRLPEEVAHRFELLGIVIDAQSEAPLPGARVRLDLEGTADLSATARDDGTFALGFDQIPDNAALTATHEGYTPGAVNIAQRDLHAGRRVVVRLRKIDPFVIVMEDEPEVHHLGNDEFSGRINSQFQRRSEGLVLQLPFEMTEAHANLPLRGAELRLLVKGTQAPNPVRINGRQIATLAQSPSNGGFGEQIISIPSGVLRLGENVLELESVARPGSDKDDYEFVNPRVVLLVNEDAPI
ncbi:MAG: hypothetical protein RIE32_07795 [Phycisphaerales bacterium]